MFKLLKSNIVFTFYWIGQLFSSTGSSFTILALSWYVYNLTESTLALGGVLLAYTIPLTLLRVFAGALVDRWDRKYTMIVTDAIRTLVLVLPVILYYVGNLEIWNLYVLNIVLGLCEAFFRPAAFTIVPNIVKKEDLISANSLMNISLTGSMLVGPILAGVIISKYGASIALLFNSITFGISLTSLLFLPNNKYKQKKENKFTQDLLNGFLFLKEHKGLLWLLGLSASTNMVMGMLMTLIVPIAIDILMVGSQGVGIMQTAIGLGYLLGSLISPLFSKYSRRLVMISAHISAGICTLCMLLTPQYFLVLVFLIGYGISVAIWNTFSNTTYQEAVPDHFRGRVQSVRLLIAQGTTPIGMAFGAAFANDIGISTSFILMGLLIIIIGLFSFFVKSIEKVDYLNSDGGK